MQKKESFRKILISLRKIKPAFLFVLFLLFTLFFPPVAFAKNLQEQAGQSDYSAIVLDADISKISDIDGPRIDDGAASISRRSPGTSQRCPNLSKGVWVFIMIAYAVLLVFNLAYGFKNTNRLRWRAGLVLTTTAILAWYVLDQCRLDVWFPLNILKVGIFIYAFYLYFFNKKQIQDF